MQVNWWWLSLSRVGLLPTHGLPGSSVHEIFPGKKTGVIAISFSRGSSRPKDHTRVFCIAGGILPLSHQGNLYGSIQFSSSVVSNSLWLWTAAHQASLSITNSQNLLNLTSIKSVMPSNHLILCCSFLLLPSIFPSIRVSILHIRWPKYCSFSFSVSPSNEYSGVISFRIDWLDLLAVQGTLKSLLQHDSSKASILRRSAFFTVQITSIHDHRKTHSLDGPLLTK